MIISMAIQMKYETFAIINIKAVNLPECIHP